MVVKPELTSERVINFIENYCKVPEGSLVGQPVKLLEFQKKFIRECYDNPAVTSQAILSIGRKNGKGLALDTPIPTPDGWRTMGDLEEGDFVFGSDGKPTRVSFVSEIHTGLKCWRVCFSDGSSVVADEQHQWLTRHSYTPWEERRVNGSGNGGRWREGVVTTPQIAESVCRPRKDGKWESNHKLTCAPATQTPETSLPIDPWVLGVWLGDGTSASGSFTFGDMDLSHMASRLGGLLGGRMTIARYSDKAATVRATGLGLQAKLRSEGLLGNKHIPRQYLNAGTEQRWELLRGLMDTDGTVTRHAGKTTARCSYTGTDEDLCRSVWRLARSLGLKATFRIGEAKLRGLVIGLKYDVAFPASKDSEIFTLSRKQSLLPDSLGKRSGSLTIPCCEPVESVPTKCIQVEATDSMFLCGEGCVPTHNTALCAFLMLAHLVGPLAVQNSQLYSAAQSKDQAALLFDLAVKVIRLHPDLNSRVTISESTKRLHCPGKGTRYRALSAEAGTAFGSSPIFVLFDELGQVQGERSQLYEALETGTQAHDQPLSIVISTQAPTDGDLLSILIDSALTGEDPSTIVNIYAAEDDILDDDGQVIDTRDPFDEETVKQANPAYGVFQNAKTVMKMADRARRMPSREAPYRNLVLNQRVETSSPFVTKKVWDSNAGAPEKFGLCYGGLDLSDTTDLTSFVMVSANDGIVSVMPHFWLPEYEIVERSRADRVPYDRWAEEGYIMLTDGRSVEYKHVAKFLVQQFEKYDLRKVGFDRWNMRHLRPWLIEAGLSEDFIDDRFEDFGQGYISMSPALRTTETILVNGRARHGGHPVLKSCAANAVVKMDEAGNRKLDKKKSRGRIDGMVALVMAAAVQEEDTKGGKVYPVDPSDFIEDLRAEPAYAAQANHGPPAIETTAG